MAPRKSAPNPLHFHPFHKFSPLANGCWPPKYGISPKIFVRFGKKFQVALSTLSKIQLLTAFIMRDKIQVRFNKIYLRIKNKQVRYCHVHGNDLVIYSEDGRMGEIKDCSFKTFCERMPDEFMADFVEVKCGHLVHESLIIGYATDHLVYEPSIFALFKERCQHALKCLSPSRSGLEALKKLDIVF
jgi:hypothetical protein